MNESARERLSALVDGELADPEAVRLLEQVAQDTELQKVWDRFHLINDAMLGRSAPTLPVGELLERVRRDLRAEPALYRFPAFRSETLRPLAGLALAASVAVVAVLGFRTAVESPQTGATQVAKREAAAPVAVAGAGFDARLGPYLVNHSERA